MALDDRTDERGGPGSASIVGSRTDERGGLGSASIVGSVEKKGRLSEVNVKLLARMTSTVKAEGHVRETVNRDESARGDTKPKSSNRAKNCWFMAGAGHRE